MAADADKLTALVLLYYSKAFYTINISIILLSILRTSTISTHISLGISNGSAVIWAGHCAILYLFFENL